MAATAATAVASSFSSSILHYIPSKTCPSDSFLKFAPSRSFPAASTSQFLGLESILIGPLGSKWRLPKVAAAVAQEEAAAAAEAVVAPIEETAAEEEKVIEEVEVEEEKGGEQIPIDTSTKLYFGNLPYHVDSAQLAGIIQDFGSPELVEVLYDRDTGKSRGFAFVTMSTIEDCNTVIQNLDGREYGGRTLRVNFSDKPRAKEPLYPETEYKLFVGNLSWSVTTESLAEAFKDCGDVIGARVLYDGETGRSRGYGFVCFKTQAEMDAALNNLNGLELEGRAIRVSLAQGKKQ